MPTNDRCGIDKLWLFIFFFILNKEAALQVDCTQNYMLSMSVADATSMEVDVTRTPSMLRM